MPRRSKLTLSHWARPVIKSGALPAATRKLATFVRGRKAQEMDQWLEDFKQTIEAATPPLLLVSEGQSEQPRTEDHWSSKQIIAHLIDSAANNHARVVLARLKDDLLFAGYEQDGLVPSQQDHQRP